MRRLPVSFMRAIGATRANSLVMAIIYGIYSLSLILQPLRWSSTPAYRNLLILMPQQAWGGIFATSSLLLGTALWRDHRQTFIVALIFAIVLTTFWDAAFVVRWATSGNTTPETWTSWFAFDFLLVRSLRLLNYQEVRIPRINGKAGGNG